MSSNYCSVSHDKKLRRSITNRLKKRGPKAVPSGTPWAISIYLDLTFLNMTLWVLFWKLAVFFFRFWSGIKKPRRERFCIMSSWLMELNAFDRAKNFDRVKFFLAFCCILFFQLNKQARLLKKTFFWKQTAFHSVMSFFCIYSSICCLISDSKTFANADFNEIGR